MNQRQLLLHVCCGPCAVGVSEALQKEGWQITYCFYNSNIQPYDEYCRRLVNFYRFLEISGQKGICPFPYQPRDFFQKVPSEMNRCQDCYRMRFQKVAEWGKEHGFKYFASTLSISPYQNQEKINLVGEQIALKYDMVFLKRNFTPFYQRSKDRSIEMNLYRQKYCGCLYSLWEGEKRRLWKFLFGQKPS